MIRARILGREVEMQGSPWTFVEYHREFGGDLLSDFADASKKDPVDFVDYLKVAWALCRTADASTPGFREWCESFEDFTLAEGEGQIFLSVINSVFMMELFRRPKTRFARWRARLRARWLGWLSRRRCSR